MKITRDLEVIELAPLTAVERTQQAMSTGDWNRARVNQARQFIKKARASDLKRKAEKACRKRNR